MQQKRFIIISRIDEKSPEGGLMLLAVLLLLLGFVLVIKGADFLVAGASSLAAIYKIPEIVIGLTIVAFGTSAPELVVNIFASLAKQNAIIYGNIVGSNIFNTLFILGVAGLIYPLAVLRNTVWKEIPFALLIGLVLLFLVNDQIFRGASKDMLSTLDGVLLLILFSLFIAYTVKLAIQGINESEHVKIYSMLITIIYIILGFVGLIWGGKLVVDKAVIIASMLGVSQKFIGLTIVAAGTSFPELATSAVAAFKKRSDIAVGNVVGSNIFNIVFIMGVSAIIRPVPYITTFNTDIVIYCGVTALLFAFMFIGKKHTLNRWQAAFFILLYVAYVAYLISVK
jgi:cation:H+ antiporter